MNRWGFCAGIVGRAWLVQHAICGCAGELSRSRLVLKIAALFGWHGDIHFCTSGAFQGTTARRRLVVETTFWRRLARSRCRIFDSF
jgi:hypothetical protein